MGNLVCISETALQFQKDSAPWGLLVCWLASRSARLWLVATFICSHYKIHMYVIYRDAIGVKFFFTSRIHAIGVYFFKNVIIKYVKDIRQTYQHSASKADSCFSSNSEEWRHNVFTNSPFNASLPTDTKLARYKIILPFHNPTQHDFISFHDVSSTKFYMHSMSPPALS